MTSYAGGPGGGRWLSKYESHQVLAPASLLQIKRFMHGMLKPCFLKRVRGRGQFFYLVLGNLESNRVIRSILGDEIDTLYKRPRISLEHQPRSSGSMSSPASKDELARQVKLGVPRVRPSTGHLFSSDPESGRQQAINAWLQIIKLDLNESLTGRQILTVLKDDLSLEA